MLIKQIENTEIINLNETKIEEPSGKCAVVTKGNNNYKLLRELQDILSASAEKEGITEEELQECLLEIRREKRGW